jgi:aminomethyltransferase
MVVSPLKRTPLFEVYREFSARLIPFGGWDLPVHFSGINDEHLAVRERAGLFDTSHMGEIRIRGDQALPFLQRVTCSDAARRRDGDAQYTAILNEEGGIIDDLIYYRISEKEFFLCVNATNTEADFQWLKENNLEELEIINESPDWVQLCIQGPRAVEIVEKLSSDKVREIAGFKFSFIRIAGIEVLAARTGYTGEHGFELFIPAREGIRLWNELIEAGKDQGLLPCGLGARDTLRLEMGYPLHGHDITPEITPLEADLEWIVAWNKPHFIGRDALLRQKQAGIKKKRIGLSMIEPGIPRHGCALKVQGQEVGTITSGTKTPCLEKPIGMGYVKLEYSEPGQEIVVQIRGKQKRAKIVETPFYRPAG